MLTETTEQVALRNVRAQALNHACDLADLAHALKAVALGHAGPGDAALVRGNVDGAGDLLMRCCLDWRLLLANSRAPGGER